jgi:hypothetical protein
MKCIMEIGFSNDYPFAYLRVYHGFSTAATNKWSKSFWPKYLLLNL